MFSSVGTVLIILYPINILLFISFGDVTRNYRYPKFISRAFIVCIFNSFIWKQCHYHKFSTLKYFQLSLFYN